MSDDLISRQAAIDAMTEAYEDTDAEWILRKIPSAERKGKWINQRNDDGHNIADCSVCGSAIQWFDDDEKPRYCCMCGARMEGEKENE